MRGLLGIASSSLLFLACGGPIASGGSVASGQHSLHISVTGPGAVHSPAIGADCSTDCRISVTAGEAIHLEAVAQNGATFAGWSGACSGQPACDLRLDADVDVRATFESVSPTNPPPPEPSPAPPPSPA